MGIDLSKIKQTFGLGSIDKTVAANAVKEVLASTPSLDAFLTGSLVVQKTGNDVDVVALADNDRTLGQDWLASEIGEADYAGDGWVAYRKDHINLIWCDNSFTFQKWRFATQLMDSLHTQGCDMSNREFRVIIFDKIVDQMPRLLSHLNGNEN